VGTSFGTPDAFGVCAAGRGFGCEGLILVLTVVDASMLRPVVTAAAVSPYGAGATLVAGVLLSAAGKLLFLSIIIKAYSHGWCSL